MKHKILAVLLSAALMLSLAACGGGSETKETTKSETTTAAAAVEDTTVEEAAVTYESILSDYSAKLKEAAPKLADEFKEEAEAKSGDVNALEELSTAKTEKLAEISVEGTE